ncbi:MAG: YfiR family protein [Bacteroidales bacterium]|jgi:hypothetical protein|nr:YfiR family protein [Bacteroidales bacterium]
MKVVILSLLLFSAGINSVFAQNERFKALFVFNFAKHIEWPAEYTAGDFVITILGNSPIFNELKQNVEGKNAGNCTIKVNRISNISGLKPCNILYIPIQQSNLLSAARKLLDGKSTLIITEKKGLITEGTDINLMQIEGRLQYEVSLKQMESKKLKISKKMLDLGIIYENASTRRMPVLESVDDASQPR